jgi:hypothetical protein
MKLPVSDVVVWSKGRMISEPCSIQSRAGVRMLLHYFIRTLEYAFFIGLAGSLVVATMAFVEDVRELFPERSFHSPAEHDSSVARAA